MEFPSSHLLIKGIMNYQNEKEMTHLLTFFSLVLLVFLNMMLFYKLWMLEYSAQSLTTWQGLRLHERYTHPHTQVQMHSLFCHFYSNSTWLTNFWGTGLYKNFHCGNLAVCPKGSQSIHIQLHTYTHRLLTLHTRKPYPYGSWHELLKITPE